MGDENHKAYTSTITSVRRCADAEDCIFLEGADLCLSQRTFPPASFLSPFLSLSVFCYDPPVCSLLFRISFPIRFV